MKNRIKLTFGIILTVFLLLSGVLCVRLLPREYGDIQSRLDQYTRTAALYYPRGRITDRNGIVLNSAPAKTAGLIELRTAYPRAAAQIVGLVEINEGDTTADGVVALSGINLLYDEILRGGGAVRVSANVDAEGRVLEDAELIVSGDTGNMGGSVMLTLDYILQSEFEAVMEEICASRNYRAAAAILSDIKSGEILAMATVGSELNMNVLSYPPGSVMKIITAAAVLEAGMVDESYEYTCTSAVAVGDRTRYCSEHTVHGTQSFAEAFSHSCNCTFYELARMLCTERGDGTLDCKMLEFARKWGFCEYGKPVPSGFILDYANYYSFVPSFLYNEMDVFNAALGEGNIQASPYLLNKIIAAIAAGGSCEVPYIVERVTDAAGNVVSAHENEREVFSLGLSSDTIRVLSDMLVLTGQSGSAAANSLSAYGGLAAKTGTAEHGEGGECHSWLCGYFPADYPRYAMTVFIERGGSAPQNALYMYDKLAVSALEILGGGN